MQKNVQTTAQLHSFHMLVKECSKSFKQGFNSMRTKNFHMYKLDLERKEEPYQMSNIHCITKIAREFQKNSCFIDYAKALYAEYIMNETHAGIKIAGRNISNLRYANDTTLMAESEEELKSLLMKVKRSGKAGFKPNIKKMKLMASSTISSKQIDGKTVETVTDFIFLGSKITADGDCSHNIKRCLLLGRKTMTNLDNILKSRDITLPTMVHIVKAMVFSSSHES